MLNAHPEMPVATLIDRWWHDCSSAACRLPKDHTHEWLELISQVVRYYRLCLHAKKPSQQRTFRSLCRNALAQSRWELMLLSIYGYLAPEQLKSLEDLQESLESSLKRSKD